MAASKPRAMIESVFEYWCEAESASFRRVVDPPRPVWVNLGVAIPTHGAFRADAVSMRVRSDALHLAGSVPGLLYAWARCTDGSWLGLVQFSVSTRNKRGRIETRQWCSGKALTVMP
ncbi:hypothetical protein [Nocardia arthritidis]|uniref:Uncharacterized protein n=1 Tax=Nocardia arthritidis TaxID=228602 RepID=A0A6G9YL26_9NOCA|nr:hypothetical protein [Nocardia arthritidis]QIS13633.1 hypothetical protein F5544_28940 [Nocardia arthritidis]